MNAQPARGLVVVIPHHSQRDRLAAALRATGQWPVIVVDDGPEPSPAMEGVEWRRTTGEEGFARAANHGLMVAAQQGYALAMVLNDDAVPQAGCIEAMHNAWQQADAPGVVAPVLIESTGAMSGGISLSSWGRVRAMGCPEGQHVREVPAVSGACVLLDTRARFDERYRHGMEDVALCQNLTRSGRQILLVPEAQCHHHGGATLPRTGAMAQRHAMSGHLLLVGAGWRTPAVVALALAQVMREGPSWGRFKAVGLGVRDHFRRVDPVVDSDRLASSLRSNAPL